MLSLFVTGRGGAEELVTEAMRDHGGGAGRNQSVLVEMVYPSYHTFTVCFYTQLLCLVNISHTECLALLDWCIILKRV